MNPIQNLMHAVGKGEKEEEGHRIMVDKVKVEVQTTVCRSVLTNHILPWHQLIILSQVQQLRSPSTPQRIAPNCHSPHTPTIEDIPQNVKPHLPSTPQERRQWLRRIPCDTFGKPGHHSHDLPDIKRLELEEVGFMSLNRY